MYCWCHKWWPLAGSSRLQEAYSSDHKPLIQKHHTTLTVIKYKLPYLVCPPEKEQFKWHGGSREFISALIPNWFIHQRNRLHEIKIHWRSYELKHFHEHWSGQLVLMFGHDLVQPLERCLEVDDAHKWQARVLCVSGRKINRLQQMPFKTLVFVCCLFESADLFLHLIDMPSPIPPHCKLHYY